MMFQIKLKKFVQFAKKKTNECLKFFAQKRKKKRKNENEINEKLYFYRRINIVQTQNVTKKTIL